VTDLAAVLLQLEPWGLSVPPGAGGHHDSLSATHETEIRVPGLLGTGSIRVPVSELRLALEQLEPLLRFPATHRAVRQRESDSGSPATPLRPIPLLQPALLRRFRPRGHLVRLAELVGLQFGTLDSHWACSVSSHVARFADVPRPVIVFLSISQDSSSC
jgi:hypothetical protein